MQISKQPAFTGMYKITGPKKDVNRAGQMIYEDIQRDQAAYYKVNTVKKDNNNKTDLYRTSDECCDNAPDNKDVKTLQAEDVINAVWQNRFNIITGDIKEIKRK